MTGSLSSAMTKPAAKAPKNTPTWGMPPAMVATTEAWAATKVSAPVASGPKASGP